MVTCCSSRPGGQREDQLIALVRACVRVACVLALLTPEKFWARGPLGPRLDSVGDVAREFSEDRSIGCAVDIRTPEQLISHIERVHHPIDLAIRAVEQARTEYLRGRVDPLRGRT